MQDVIVGLVSLAKGDLEFIRPLALHLGGFPDNQLDKLEEIIMVIKQFKEGLSFGEIAKTVVVSNVDTVVAALPVPIVGGQKVAQLIKKGIEDPASLFEPANMFEVFANERGTVTLEEFKNIFTQLGINVPHAVML